MLTELVREKLAETFSDSRREEAEQVLSTLPETVSERVVLAVLKLSNGDVASLVAAVENAQLDYRDVLAWAEYPEEMALGPGADAESLVHARARDLEHYSRWLRRLR